MKADRHVNRNIPLVLLVAAGLLSIQAEPQDSLFAAPTPRRKSPEKVVTPEKAAPVENSNIDSQTFGKRGPDEMVRIFLDIYKTRGGANAVDYIYSNNPYIFEKKDHMASMKEKLNRMPEILGKNCGDILIQDRVFKGSIRIITYLVKHERQPLRFTFIFYKPVDHWITYQFGFDDAVTDDVIKETQRLGFEPVVQ